MKRIVLVLLAAALLLVGCAAEETPDPHPDWDPDWFRVSEDLGVETPAGFTLNESNDVMSMVGLYYATWTAGEGRAFTNAQEQEATVYDAQLYVLVKLCESPEEAEADVEDWMAREASSYRTGEETECSAAGQSFRVLPLLEGSAENPYHHGRAAFAIRGAEVITAELLCAEDWPGDPDATLQAFLAGFHYGSE